MSFLPGARPLGRGSLLLDLLIAALLSLLFFGYYQFASTHLCGTDPYYHIKFAQLTRTQGPILDFPWAQWSSWRDAFFDKEVLYHLYLSLFTYGDLMQGAKVANVILGSAIFTVFMLVLRLNGVRWAWFWWFMLISSGGYFLFRMNVTRPQVFSVLILLLGIHFLINERHHIVGLISLIYSLSYTGHYQYVGLALGYVGVVYLMEKRLPWKLFVWALCGMLLGWVVHPNFPNNVSGFFLQNVLVIANQWAPTVNLNMGGEMNPMTTRSLLGVNSSTLIPLWLAFTVALIKRPVVPTRTAFLFACSTLYLILMLFTKRFAEYWIPVTTLFSAVYFTPLLQGWQPVHALYRFFSDRPLIGSKVGGMVAIGAITVGLGFMFVRSHFDSFKQVNRCGESTYAPSARYVRDHIPKGKQVLTCDWDDAPYLFYYSHKHYYTVFLDPNFMYAWRPSVWHTWNELTHPGPETKHKNPVTTLRDFFHADYVYCTSDFAGFRQQLSRTEGAVQIYPPATALDLARRCRQGDCFYCSQDSDCTEGAICKHPGHPNKPQLKHRKRCESDPHVFIFRVN